LSHSVSAYVCLCAFFGNQCLLFTDTKPHGCYIGMLGQDLVGSSINNLIYSHKLRGWEEIWEAVTSTMKKIFDLENKARKP
jgi:hypothetical protein